MIANIPALRFAVHIIWMPRADIVPGKDMNTEHAKSDRVDKTGSDPPWG